MCPRSKIDNRYFKSVPKDFIYIYRKRLSADTVPVNKKYLRGTVPANKEHLTGTVGRDDFNFFSNQFGPSGRDTSSMWGKKKII